MKRPAHGSIALLCLMFTLTFAYQAMGEDPAERLLRFPSEVSMGSLSVWNDCGSDWAPFGDAKGEVAVPAGKRLRLEVSKKAGGQLKGLANLSPNDLQALRIEEIRLTPEQLSAISTLKGLQSLELVKSRIDKKTVKALIALQSLKVVKIEDTGLSEKWLAPLAKFRALEELSLRETRANDKSLASLGKLKRLKQLDLTGTRITDDGLKHIGGLRDLRSLDLSGTSVTDAGMIRLAKLTKLEKLQLPGNISEQGIAFLKGLPAYALLASRTTLRLSVVDAATNQGMPGEPIKIGSGPEIGLKNITTDRQGQCIIYLPAEKPTYLSVTAEVKGYVPTKMVWEASEGRPVPAEFTMPLQKGTAIGGVVVDDSGQPIEGVRVSLLVPGEGYAWPRPAIWEQVESTDEQGKWRCDIMPEKLDDVWIKLSHKDYISDPMFGATPKPPMEKLRDMTGQMVLKRGITISGKVTDKEGKPVAGARVAQGEDRWGSDYPSTHTGQDGVFSFKNCKPGAMTLTVQKEGYSPDLRKVSVDKTMSSVDFILEKGGITHGRVVEKDGQPVAGAHVVADTWRGCRTIEWRAKTDADGRFQWDSAPADAVAYDIIKENYMANRRQTMTPGDAENVITLHHPLKISGTVVSAENGQPVPAFQVYGGADWGNGSPVYWNRRDPVQGKDGQYMITLDEPRPGHLLRIEAEGYLPAISRAFKNDEGEQTCDLKLDKGMPIKGVVHAPDGALLSGADVVFCTPSAGAYFQNGVLGNKSDSTVATTDAQGAFAFPPATDPYLLAVIHERGYAEVDQKTFEKDPVISLQAWTRVEGRVHIGGKPAPNEDVILAIDRPYDPKAPRMNMHYQTTTDAAGRFAFDRVVAEGIRVCRGIKTGVGRTSYSHGTWVETKPGQTTQVDLGGNGCPVKGKVTLPSGDTVQVNWDFCDCTISVKQEQVKPPKVLTQEKMQAWYNDWQKSEAGKKQRREQRSFVGVIGPDGTFEIQDVPAGVYNLNIHAYQPPEGRYCGFGPEIGHVSKEITIAEMPGGRSDTPVDVGVLELSLRKELKPGMPAPDFDMKTLDGKPLKLSEFRGKYVLLDFWATWCGPCRGETPKLKEVQDAFGSNPKFVLISLSLDPEAEAPRKYAKENGLNWTQGFLGDWQKTKVPDQYGVQGIPAIFLIDPEGKLVKSGLRGDAILQSVKEAVK